MSKKLNAKNRANLFEKLQEEAKATDQEQKAKNKTYLQTDFVKEFDPDLHQETALFYNPFDSIRYAIYITQRGEKIRTNIALDGYMVNALIDKIGLNKKDIPKFLQNLVDNWSVFDGLLPVTKQVKYLVFMLLMRVKKWQ